MSRRRRNPVLEDTGYEDFNRQKKKKENKMPKISIEFNANASNSLESILELQSKICEYSKNMTEFHSSRMEKEFDLREISQMFLMNMYGRWQASLGAVLCVGTPELLQEMDEFFKQISNKAIETKKGE